MNYLFMDTMQQTGNFGFLDWTALAERVSHPPLIEADNAKEAKAKSPAITASDCNSKRLDAITRHDHFTLLRLDLDDTDHSMMSIYDGLSGLGIGSCLVHTTASHHQDGKGNRYRVYIELAHGVNLDTWRIVQTYLAYSMGADDCSGRPQQIMFLPVRFTSDDYHYRLYEGKPLSVFGSALFDNAIAFDVEQKRQALLTEQEKTKQVKPPYPERLINGQVSMIDAINQGYSWPELLSQYGYKRQGRAWLAPESTSKMAGVYLLTGQDGKARYYSHHSSDPCAVGHCIDKFDFLTLRAFGGDAKTALKTLSQHFPEHHAHNKRQYIEYQQALKLQMIKEAL